MKIKYHHIEVPRPSFGRKRLSTVLDNTIKNKNKVTGDISIVFCSDEYLLEINREHLGHDFYTDIITFDYCEDDTVSGDLFISIDRVKENAKSFGKNIENEIVRVAGHGVLHLLGFNDKTEEDQKEMTKCEDILVLAWSQSK